MDKYCSDAILRYDRYFYKNKRFDFSVFEKSERTKAKKVLIFIVSIFIITALAIGVFVMPIASSGYEMYQSAITQTSLNHVISKVRSDDTYVKLEDISDNFLKQVLRAEDKRFYAHSGIDFIATARAMYKNLKAHSFIQGGSGITQQLAKNMYFSSEKKLERKVAELFVAFDLERLLSKNQILELYCNIVYFGENCYGLEEAAKHYYGVAADRLTEVQAASLVLTLKSPNRNNPNIYRISTNHLN